MKLLKTLCILSMILAASTELVASGPVGIYGIVEKVVFEPDARTPERIQVWGAFAYVDGGSRGGLNISAAKRGYLYFKLPAVAQGFTATGAGVVMREWRDLETVAGTGQAIGFGAWGYIGRFDGLQPDARSSGPPPYILERAPQGGGVLTDLRVRPATEAPANPATYQTNAGMIKLSERGSHASIVKQLREALAR